VATHDEAIAAMADRAVKIEDGRLFTGSMVSAGK
jgi:ABC-type lipoprotein export system ATPase subunit